MTTEELLLEVEPLRHSDRVRRLVELGRNSLVDPNTAQLIETLWTGGPYQRWLALHACYGSRNGDYVLDALLDPSATIRRLAVALVPLCCDDDQAVTALRTSSCG